jgi:hypothetical protein
MIGHERLIVGISGASSIIYGIRETPASSMTGVPSCCGDGVDIGWFGHPAGSGDA